MVNPGGEHSARKGAGIRLRLLGPIALTVLAMLALAFYGYSRLTQLVLQDGRAESQGLARQAAREYSETLSRAFELLSALSQFPEISQIQQPACENSLAALVKELKVYANLGSVSPGGVLQCSALGSTPIDMRDRGWYQRALASHRPSVGDFQIGKLTKQPTINVALPVQDERGELRQILYAAVVVEPLGESLSGVLPVGASVTVIDRKGVVLARSPEPQKWVGRNVSQAPLIREALQNPNGSGARDGLDEVRRLYAWTTLGPPANPEGVVLVGLSEEQLVGAREHVVARTMAALVGFGLLLFGVMWLISSLLVVRRIDALASYSRRLQAGGTPESGSGVGGHDEVSELARAMEDLARSNREALQAREDFLSAATHELRAPITTVFLQCERLARESAGDPALAKRVIRLQNNVARMAKLVDSLLDVSRLQAGHFDVQRTPMDLAKVLRRTVERYEDVAESAGCPLLLQSPEAVEGNWDPTRLEIAFGNLVSNAIKYGPGQPVTITLEPLDHEVRVRITDQGVGIPPEQREQIFERFKRARTSSGKPGFGFGLYLTRQIIEAHGGSIRVDSEVGRGSTFEVRLPR